MDDATHLAAELEHPPRRQKSVIACNSCRRRKSKCNGARPACDRCLRLNEECHYEYDRKTSRHDSLKRHLRDVTANSDALEALVNQLRSCSDIEAADMIRQLRSGTKVSDPFDRKSVPSDSNHAASSRFQILLQDDVEQSDGYLLRPVPRLKRINLDRPTVDLPRYEGPSSLHRRTMRGLIIVARGYVELFGHLPMSRSIMAAHYPIAIQRHQVLIFQLSVYFLPPCWDLDRSGFSRVIQDYRDFARSFFSTSTIPDSNRTNVMGFLNERSPAMPVNEQVTSTSIWASEISKGFDDVDVFVRLACLYFLTKLMMWMISPTVETYEMMPDLIKPTLIQIMVPHIPLLDTMPLPALRRVLVQHPRDCVTACASSLSVNWPHGIETAVHKDRIDGHLYLTHEFIGHACNPTNWTVGGRFLEIFPELRGRLHTAPEDDWVNLHGVSTVKFRSENRTPLSSSVRKDTKALDYWPRNNAFVHEQFLASGAASLNLQAELEEIVRPLEEAERSNSDVPETEATFPVHLATHDRERNPTTFKTKLVRLGLVNPDPEPGMQRIHWQCACGQRLFDDYAELKPGALEELQKKLDHSTSRTPRRTKTQYQHNSASFPSRPSFKRLWTSFTDWFKTRPTSRVNETLPTSRPSTTITTSQDSGSGQPVEQMHLLICTNTGQHGVLMRHRAIDSVRSDRDLFRNLRYAYRDYQGRFMSHFSLRVIHGIDFVKFTLLQGDYVDVYEHGPKDPLRLPPRELVEGTSPQYRCSPIPPGESPPIGPNGMLHFLKSPDCLKEDNIWILNQMPKKVQGLLSGRCDKPVLGWGIHFREGWHWNRIWTIMLIVFVLGSFLFGVLWAICEQDIQGAFGAASWWLSGATIFLGYLATKQI